MAYTEPPSTGDDAGPDAQGAPPRNDQSQTTQPATAPAGSSPAASSADVNRYWKANLSLLGKLLAVWFIASFLFGILLVDVLNQVPFFGFKLGFWFAQQGSIYTFVALIFVYARQMKKLDRQFGVED